jgi:hypothetical protein
MTFPLHQHEWWFCQDPNCGSSDRVYGLQAQTLAHVWLQQLKDDPVRIHILRDMVRSDISLPVFRIGDATLVSRIEHLLSSGRLHLHKKEPEIHGSGVQDQQVPFPLSDRQPRAASSPPPVIDPPTFSSKGNLSAQAAALVAAAASGVPFSLE